MKKQKNKGGNGVPVPFGPGGKGGASPAFWGRGAVEIGDYFSGRAKTPPRPRTDKRTKQAVGEVVVAWEIELGLTGGESGFG